ncbi:MAG: hypothetical protein U1F83_04210 [Verrucomicrobiota bacterium]
MQEYIAGTDPQSAASWLRIDSATQGGEGVELHFTVANRSYTNFTATHWQVERG